MKTVLRPVVRRVRRLYGQPGRPSRSAEAVLARWRTLSSKLLSKAWFTEAGLDDIWERNPPKFDRQVIVMQSLRNVIAGGIDGVVAEFGCFRGHTAVQLARTMRELGDDSRLILFDSFRGMPASDDANDRYWCEGAMTADEDEVRARFADFPNVTVVGGFFSDSLPGFEDVQVKLAHVDCDMAASVRDVHDWLLDRVVPTGIIVYDDYGFEACLGLMHEVDAVLARRDDYITYSLPTGQYVAIRRQE
ncbi:MAG: TylF/MycF/NovP-related O-methyltransferase [Planctomycetota bacterium]|jgi:O-methyltransferase